MGEVIEWPRAVRVEFTRPKAWFSPVSWAIRRVERTPYSHVRLRWFLANSEEIIYEASGTRVKAIGRFAQVPTEILVAYTFYLNKEQDEALRRLFRFANVNYGKLQILGILISRLLGRKRNLFSRGNDRMVCSELVAYFLLDVLRIPIPLEKFDLIGPKGIKELLDKEVNNANL